MLIGPRPTPKEEKQWLWEAPAGWVMRSGQRGAS